MVMVNQLEKLLETRKDVLRRICLILYKINLFHAVYAMEAVLYFSAIKK